MTGSGQIWAFIRFLMVGGGFAFFYAVVTASLIRFADAPPLQTSVIVYLLCIPAAFIAQKKVVFRTGQSGKSSLLIYVTTQVASLFIVSMVTSQFVTKNFLIDTTLFLVTAGTAAIVSYLICRFIVFRPQPQ